MARFVKKTATRAEEVAAVEVKQAVAAADSLSVGSVIDSIGTLTVKAQSSLQELSGKLIENITSLSNLKVAIKSAESRLKELHDIEAESISIDTLKTQKDDLAAEIATLRGQWANEEQTYTDDLNQLREREEEAYQYNLKIKHRDDSDKLSLTLATQKSNHDKMLESSTAALNLRASTVSAAEAELNELRKLKDSLPELLRKAEATGDGKATTRLTKDYEHASQLMKLDAASCAQVAQSEKASLITANESLKKQIEAANSAVREAEARAAKIASDAFAAVSGKDKADALAKALSEQNNGTRK